MKIGRNDACPCGSGRKYKKCCLPRDDARERELRLQVQDEEPGESEYRPDPIEPGKTDGEECEEFDSGREPESAFGSDEEEDEDEMVDGDKYPQVDLTLPDLSSEDQAVVDQWWKEVEPFYENKDLEEMLRRVQSFLDTHPGLFPHLGVDEEFLFELGAELGRRQQWAVYSDILERLRREQPKAYSFAFYIFDYELIAERVVQGRTDEISYCLSFFKEYPDSGPDFCSMAINLLAWRGLEQPLYELAEATAVPLLTSSNVMNGRFSMQWLVAREIIPFLEMKDASASATNAVMDGLKALSKRLKYQLAPEADSI